MVLGDDRPAVAQQLHVAAPGIDHWLDGEGHSGFERHAGGRLAVMQDLRILVKDPADPVAAVLTHHRVTLALDERLDGMSEVAEARAGADDADAPPHGLEPDLAQAPGLDRGFTDLEHAAGVAVEAILDDRDVHIDDVPRPDRKS